MKQKYNLALIPARKDEEIREIAKQFSSLSDSYLLGNESLPHVTLCQFELDPEELQANWNKVCDVWLDPSIELSFKDFSCISFDNEVHWASLMPNNREQLTKMHALIADTLGLPIKKTYDPHMTLFNTKNINYKSYVDQFAKMYSPITDTFNLCLGSADNIGQLTKILLKYEDKITLSCRI